MQLKNRYYPYPVLREGNFSYKNSSFDSSVLPMIDGYNIRVVLEVKLNDEKLSSMIESGEAEIIHHFECSKTCKRYAVKSKDYVTEHVLRHSDVSGQVQVCTFLVAAKDIIQYTNRNFAGGYEGLSFDLEKGSVLAIGNQYNIDTLIAKDDLSNTSSIFSIIPNMDDTETNMLVDLKKEKIVITLPKRTFSQYRAVSSDLELYPVMHQMIIIPALIYTFSELKLDCLHGEFYTKEEFKWFRALRRACERIGIAMEEESILSIDSVKTAQLLLDSPIVKSIEHCVLGKGDDGINED